MTKRVLQLAAATFIAAGSIPVASAQDARHGYTFERGYPSGQTAEQAIDNADLRRAIEAYKFFFPTVATEGVFQQFVPHGMVPNEVGIIMPQDPEQQFAYANQDTPYILGHFDLSEGPMVVELPDGPYIGGVNDHNEEWIADSGIIGPTKGKAEKTILLPPGYDGVIPDGYRPVRSKTVQVLWWARVLSATGSYDEAVEYANKVQAYHIADSGKTSTYRVIDIKGKPAPNPMLAWEHNIKYWENLDKVLQEEPVQEKYRVMNGMLHQLGIRKGAPFAPDARMKEILEEAARIGFDEMSVTYFANPDPDRLVWEDRTWEFIPVVGAFDPRLKEWGGPSYRDLNTSDAYFWAGFGTSAAIGARKAGSGSMYFTTPRDATGVYLDGGKNYRLNVPGPVPARLFWSVTVYDTETRCIIDSGQGRGAVRSLHEKPVTNADGSYDIYYGPDKPTGKEKNWVRTIPGKGWFTTLRMYGPTEEAFSTYKLPNIEKIR